MRTTENTTPLKATHPGSIILDELTANDLTQSDLAKQIGYKKSQLNEIIKGKRSINADLAVLLEKALGVDAEYWLEVQKNYDLDNARVRLNKQKRLEALEKWKMIKDQIPVSFFKKEKVISGDPVKDNDTIKDIYGIQNFEELIIVNTNPVYARFRKSTKLQVNPINVIGWVKLVQFKGGQLNVADFDYKRKDELITELKNIIVRNSDTLNRTKQVLSDFGIKLIYQRKGEKTPIDGITFWSNGSPAIGMTLRHKRLDNFVFTLFHELGHIYEHLINNSEAEFVDLYQPGERKMNKGDKEEVEADRFALNHLIDPVKWKYFFRNREVISDHEIISFARINNIHPCIVRGRINHDTGNYRVKTSIDNSIN
ncbi:MAG: addiction module antidote protein, HigA family [Bacteroidetes bacterium]|nr:MAG: addiction module antidote protein, HigA family [Bacteroidota bacterium]